MSLYDVRDGELVLKLDTKHVVASMDFSSPVQWCSKSKYYNDKNQTGTLGLHKWGLRIWELVLDRLSLDFALTHVQYGCCHRAYMWI
jgi:hypothetical protein